VTEIDELAHVPSPPQLLQPPLSNRLPAMSDPSPPQALPDAPDEARAPAGSTWAQRGGLRGCFDGRQSLAATFWVLGVGVSGAIMIAGLVISAGLQTEAFGVVLFSTTLLPMITRAAAWYAIVQCRHNTRSPVFTALALIAVALDMVFGTVKWPAILFATLVS
jgi:hypothetical protein